MRTTLKNHNEVMHYWANKVQPEGRCGSVYFVGPTIYSYGRHFPMATHVTDKLVAVTRATYSMTTSGHLSALRRYIPEGLTVIRVPILDGSEKATLEVLQRSVATLMLKAKRARIYTEMHLSEAKQQINDYNVYAEAKGWKPATRLEDDAAVTELMADLERTVIEQAAREKEARARREEQEKQRLIKLREEISDKIIQWREGIVDYLGRITGLPPMLRLKDDMVQTSWGAEIPVEAAKLIWPYVRDRRAIENQTLRRLGVYTLQSINADGSIVVGCHHIEFDEIEGIAHQLGLTDTSVQKRSFDALTT